MVEELEAAAAEVEEAAGDEGEQVKESLLIRCMRFAGNIAVSVHVA